MFPLKNHYITDTFGNRNYGGSGRKRPYGPHSGVDAGSKDKTIYAPRDSTVTELYYDKVKGWTMELDVGNIQDEFYHIKSVKKGDKWIPLFKVNKGQKVKRGQPLATYGNTGTGSKGAHMHWTVRIGGRKVDPMGTINNEPPKPKGPPFKLLTPKTEKLQTNKVAQQWDLNFRRYADAKSVRTYQPKTPIHTTGVVIHDLGGTYRTVNGSPAHQGINQADLEPIPPPPPPPPPAPKEIKPEEDDGSFVDDGVEDIHRSATPGVAVEDDGTPKAVDKPTTPVVSEPDDILDEVSQEVAEHDFTDIQQKEPTEKKVAAKSSTKFVTRLATQWAVAKATVTAGIISLESQVGTNIPDGIEQYVVLVAAAVLVAISQFGYKLDSRLKWPF